MIICEALMLYSYGLMLACPYLEICESKKICIDSKLKNISSIVNFGKRVTGMSVNLDSAKNICLCFIPKKLDIEMGMA